MCHLSWTDTPCLEEGNKVDGTEEKERWGGRKVSGPESNLTGSRSAEPRHTQYTKVYRRANGPVRQTDGSIWRSKRDHIGLDSHPGPCIVPKVSWDPLLPSHGARNGQDTSTGARVRGSTPPPSSFSTGHRSSLETPISINEMTSGKPTTQIKTRFVTLNRSGGEVTSHKVTTLITENELFSCKNWFSIEGSDTVKRPLLFQTQFFSSTSPSSSGRHLVPLLT